MAVDYPGQDLPRGVGNRGGSVAFDWPESGAQLDLDFFTASSGTVWDVASDETVSAADAASYPAGTTFNDADTAVATGADAPSSVATMPATSTEAGTGAAAQDVTAQFISTATEAGAVDAAHPASAVLAAVDAAASTGDTAQDALATLDAAGADTGAATASDVVAQEATAAYLGTAPSTDTPGAQADFLADETEAGALTDATASGLELFADGVEAPVDSRVVVFKENQDTFVWEDAMGHAFSLVGAPVLNAGIMLDPSNYFTIPVSLPFAAQDFTLSFYATAAFNTNDAGQTLTLVEIPGFVKLTATSDPTGATPNVYYALEVKDSVGDVLYAGEVFDGPCHIIRMGGQLAVFATGWLQTTVTLAARTFVTASEAKFCAVGTSVAGCAGYISDFKLALGRAVLRVFIPDDYQWFLDFKNPLPIEADSVQETPPELFAQVENPLSNYDVVDVGMGFDTASDEPTASDAAHDATADMLADEQEPATSDAAHDGDTGAQTASVDEMLIGLNNYCSNSEFVGVTTGNLPTTTVGGQFVFHGGAATAFCDIVAVGTEFGDPYIDVRFYGYHGNAFGASRISLSEILGGGHNNRVVMTVSAMVTLLSPLPQFNMNIGGSSAGLKLTAGACGSLLTGAATSSQTSPKIAEADLPVGVRTYISTTYIGVSGIATPFRAVLSLSYPNYPTPFDVTVRISRVQFNYGGDVGYSPTNGPASQVAYRRPANDSGLVGWVFPTSESATADTAQDAPVTGVDADQTDTATPVEDQTATQATNAAEDEAGTGADAADAQAQFVSDTAEPAPATELVSASGQFVATLTEAGASLAEQLADAAALVDQTDTAAPDAAQEAAAEMATSVDEFSIGYNNWVANSEFVGIGVGPLPPDWAFLPAGSGMSAEVVGVGVEEGANYVDIRIYGTVAGNVDAVVHLGAAGYSPSEMQIGVTSCSAYLTVLSHADVGSIVCGMSLTSTYTSQWANSSASRTIIPFSSGRQLHTKNIRNTSQQFRSYGVGLRFTLQNLTSFADTVIRVSQPQVSSGASGFDYSPTTGLGSVHAVQVPPTHYDTTATTAPTIEATAADTEQTYPPGDTVPADQTDTAAPDSEQDSTQATNAAEDEAGTGVDAVDAQAQFVSDTDEPAPASELVSASGQYVAALTEDGTSLAEQLANAATPVDQTDTAAPDSTQTTTQGTSSAGAEPATATDTPASTAAFASTDAEPATAADAQDSTYVTTSDETDAATADSAQDYITGTLADTTQPGAADTTQTAGQGTTNAAAEPGAATDTPVGAAAYPVADAESSAASDTPAGAWTTTATQTNTGTAGTEQDGIAGTMVDGSATGTASATHPALAVFVGADTAPASALDAPNSTALMGTSALEATTANALQAAGWVTLATITNAGSAASAQDFLAATIADHTSTGTAGESSVAQRTQLADAVEQVFSVDTPVGTVVFLVSGDGTGAADTAQDSGGAILAAVDEVASLLETLLAQLIGAAFIDKNLSYVLREVAETFVLQGATSIEVMRQVNEVFVPREEVATVEAARVENITNVEF